MHLITVVVYEEDDKPLLTYQTTAPLDVAEVILAEALECVKKDREAADGRTSPATVDTR